MSDSTPSAAVDPTALLSEHTRHDIDAWVAKFPEGKQRSAVLAALRATPLISSVERARG